MANVTPVMTPVLYRRYWRSNTAQFMNSFGKGNTKVEYTFGRQYSFTSQSSYNSQRAGRSSSKERHYQSVKSNGNANSKSRILNKRVKRVKSYGRVDLLDRPYAYMNRNVPANKSYPVRKKKESLQPRQVIRKVIAPMQVQHKYPRVITNGFVVKQNGIPHSSDKKHISNGKLPGAKQNMSNGVVQRSHSNNMKTRHRVKRSHSKVKKISGKLYRKKAEILVKRRYVRKRAVNLIKQNGPQGYKITPEMLNYKYGNEWHANAVYRMQQNAAYIHRRRVVRNKVKRRKKSSSLLSWWLKCPILILVVLIAVCVEMSIYLALIRSGRQQFTSTVTSSYEPEVTTITSDTIPEPITTPQPRIARFDALYPNPGDYRVFSLRDQDDNYLTVFGTKDTGNGQVQRFDIIKYTPSSKPRTFMTLNQDSLISKLISANNIILQYDWAAGLNSISLTAVARNGTIQANVQVNQHSDESNNIIYNRRKRSIGSRVQHNNAMHRNRENSNWFYNNRSRRQITNPTQIQVPIIVESCKDEIPDAFVLGKIYSNYSYSIGSPSTESWTDETEVPSQPYQGIYKIMLPQVSSNLLSQSLCEAIENMLTNKCANIVPTLSLLQSACTNLEETLGNIDGVDSIDVNGIVEVCNQVPAAMELLCSYYIRAATGTSSLNSQCLQNPNIQDIYFKLQGTFGVLYQAILSDGILKQARDVEVYQFSPTLSIGFTVIDAGIGEPFQIASLYPAPTDPTPKESYTVQIRYRCADFGFVHMYIIGTDTYENAVKCEAFTRQCELKVPGARALVKDKWKIRFKDTAGSVRFERKLAVTF